MNPNPAVAGLQPLKDPAATSLGCDCVPAPVWMIDGEFYTRLPDGRVYVWIRPPVLPTSWWRRFVDWLGRRRP